MKGGVTTTTSQCFTCDELNIPLTEEALCDDASLCEHTEYTDYGNCVYHSNCCQTLKVITDTPAGSGFYSKIHVEGIPFVVYKKAGPIPLIPDTSNPPIYLHYIIDEKAADGTIVSVEKWAISNNFWEPTEADAYATSEISTTNTAPNNCPDELTLWKTLDGNEATIKITCEDVEFPR